MNTFLIAEIILVHCKKFGKYKFDISSSRHFLLIHRVIYIHNTNIQTHMGISSLLSFVKYSYIGKEHYRQKSNANALRLECIRYVSEQHGTPMWLKWKK